MEYGSPSGDASDVLASAIRHVASNRIIKSGNRLMPPPEKDDDDDDDDDDDVAMVGRRSLW